MNENPRLLPWIGGATAAGGAAFSPLVSPIDETVASLALANSSEFGLQGACFTKSLDTAFKVSRKRHVGSLCINDARRFRLDTYPFGGVGASGFGREGVRYTMEELSRWKFTGMRL
jgi:glyceraldehyde-3-phosphate dehydrogenase (NADP+)